MTVKKSAELKKTWVKCAAASATVAQLIHETAVATLEHYATIGKGDTSLCAFAINSMWKTGANRRALIQWFEKHGRMKAGIDEASKGVKFNKKPNTDHTTIDLDRAAASPYYMDDDAMGRTDADLKVFSGPDEMLKLVRKQRSLEAGEGADKYDLAKSEYLPEELLDMIENYAQMLKGSKDTAPALFKGVHKATDGEAAAMKVAAVA